MKTLTLLGMENEVAKTDAEGQLTVPVQQIDALRAAEIGLGGNVAWALSLNPSNKSVSRHIRGLQAQKPYMVATDIGRVTSMYDAQRAAPPTKLDKLLGAGEYDEVMGTGTLSVSGLDSVRKIMIDAIARGVASASTKPAADDATDGERGYVVTVNGKKMILGGGRAIPMAVLGAVLGSSGLSSAGLEAAYTASMESAAEVSGPALRRAAARVARATSSPCAGLRAEELCHGPGYRVRAAGDEAVDVAGPRSRRPRRQADARPRVGPEDGLLPGLERGGRLPRRRVVHWRAPLLVPLQRHRQLLRQEPPKEGASPPSSPLLASLLTTGTDLPDGRTTRTASRTDAVAAARSGRRRSRG